MRTHEYYVYIVTNESWTLYTGVTNNLERRVWEHKHKSTKGFTSKYRIAKLVYCGTFGDIRDAIAREKQIKGWTRAKKWALIKGVNPVCQDLSKGWFQEGDASLRSA
jgi:putative endonuclease